MRTLKKESIGEILIRQGLVTRPQLEDALAEQTMTRERLGEILCRRGYLRHEDLMEALQSQLEIPLYRPSQDAVEPSALEVIPLDLARKHKVLPIRIQDGVLSVAVADPLDVEMTDQLHRICQRHQLKLHLLLSTVEELDRSRDNHYRRIEQNRSVNQLIDKVVVEIGEVGAADEEPTAAEAEERAQDAGVIRLVDQIIAQALEERATDIHIEPLENGIVIRYRVDGLLYDALTPPRAVYTGTISRIKILANMDIAERRAAQDGRFTHRRGGREVDVRVSCIPTIQGEKIVMRLLNKSGFNFSLQDLGFTADDYEKFIHAIRQPYGMVLLSGPTGSGKSTTLYAGLLELATTAINIVTVEDPVEYQIARINQIQVNERKKLTFANVLRSFLRQDPDVIMVGEIRDNETAEIAVRAALTGHMVFSTIHANDAPSTAARLVSMGVESFMAASALSLVAAQRLVRRNCEHCLEEYRPSEEHLLAVRLADSIHDEGRPAVFRRGVGCVSCKGRGFQGRIAIVELMVLSPALRQQMAENRPASDLRTTALGEGMRTLRDRGIEKALAGTTTIEEILRVCLSDE